MEFEYNKTDGNGNTPKSYPSYDNDPVAGTNGPHNSENVQENLELPHLVRPEDLHISKEVLEGLKLPDLSSDPDHTHNRSR